MVDKFQTCKITFTAAIIHEDDFLYSKQKEELAHRIRSDLRDNLFQSFGQLQPRIGFDDDGDIRVSGKSEAIYALRKSTFFTVDQTVRQLAAAAPVQLADVTNAIFGLRPGLQTEAYAFRLSLSLRYEKPIAADTLKNHRFPDLAGLSPILGASAKIQELDFSLRTNDSGRDTWIQFDSRRDRLEFSYYVREGAADRTFPEFIQGLSLRDTLEKQIRPTIENLLQEPAISASVFEQ